MKSRFVVPLLSNQPDNDDDDKAVVLKGNNAASQKRGAAALLLADIFSDTNHANDLFSQWKKTSELNPDAAPKPRVYEPVLAPAPVVEARRPRGAFTSMLRFRYLVPKSAGSNDGGYKREDRLVAERADEYSRTLYPDRVLLAYQIRNPGWKPGLLNDRGKPVPQYIYEFVLFPNFPNFLSEFSRLPNQEMTYFAVAEEGEPIFVYFDLELPLCYCVASVHGTDKFRLFGYALMVLRSLLEQALGVPHLAAWSDSYLMYDSSIANQKWSMHCHIAWPFRDISALREATRLCSERLYEMDKRDLPFVKPLFYDSMLKEKELSVKPEPGAPPVMVRKVIVDVGVWTKKRNMRMPENTKRDKRSTLRHVVDPCWYKARSEGGPLCQELHHHLSAGALLCRQSRVLWSEQCLNDTALAAASIDRQILQSSDSTVWSKLNAVQVGDCSEDFFRLLPLSGVMNEYQAWMQELFATDVPLSHSRVEEAFTRAMRILFDMDWSSFITPTTTTTSADPNHDATLEELYWVCCKSSHATGTAVLFLCEWIVPGLPLERQYQISSERHLLRDVLTQVKSIQGARRRGEVLDLFGLVFGMVLAAENYHSGRKSVQQQQQKTQFARTVLQEFKEHMLADLLRHKSSYNKILLSNVQFLQMLSRRLLLCSGIYVHELRYATSAAAATTATSFLPLQPEHSSLDVRVMQYRYAFDWCMSDTKQYAAVPVFSWHAPEQRQQQPTQRLLPGALDGFAQLSLHGALGAREE